MGSYAYCFAEDCDRGLDKPTLRQALGLKEWACSRGHINVVREDEKEAIAQEFEALAERIERIERHLWPDPMEE